MAIGDYLIRRNASDSTTALSTSNSDLAWDTEVKAFGTGITYSAGTFTLAAAGVYLVIYNEKFYTADTTSNTRIEIQGELVVGGTAVQEGRSQIYLRKTGGHQSSVARGSALIRTTGTNTSLVTRFYRTDSHTDAGVLRVVNQGGVQIIRIDETDNFARYTTTAGLTFTADTAKNVTNWTNTEQDTGFSRSTDTVTVTTAGRYLIAYNADFTITPNSRSEFTMWVEDSSTIIPGSFGETYLRGYDSEHDGAISGMFIADLGASASLTLQAARNEGGTTSTLNTGAVFNMWQIPSAGDVAIMEATTGDMNLPGTFTWDTLPHIDTASFTATAGNSNIDTDDAAGTYLVLANTGRTAYVAGNRSAPNGGVRANGTNLTYGRDSTYVRGSGTAGQGANGAHAIVHDFPAASLEYQVIERLSSTTTAIANQSGNFAVLSLGSLYTYTYPPVISNIEDEAFTVGETNIVVDGATFDSPQGTGKVEIGSTSVYATATKTEQTSIDSWADTQIQFDMDFTSQAEGTVYVFVTNDDGDTSSGYAVNVGWPPYNPVTDMTVTPDHFWTLDNTLADSVGSNNVGSTIRGTPTMVLGTVSRSTTYKYEFDDGDDGAEVPDSDYTNVTNTHSSRRVGGWVTVDSYQLLPAAIYEEGGGVNNMYFILGFGNILLANVADSNNNWKVQAYSNAPLIPDRPYHIVLAWEGTGGYAECQMFVDGVLQDRRDGAIITATMALHSGDWSFGEPDGSLDTGGTDITYKAVDTFGISNWGTWSNTGGGIPTNTQIRDELFRDGVDAKYKPSSGTEAAIQLEFDDQDDTTLPDWPCEYQLSGSSSGSYELTATNQVIPDECQLHVVYTGSDTLTIRNSGTSNFDTAKTYSPLGGTVAIIEAAPVKVTVTDIDTGLAIENARVRIEADTGGPLSAGVVVLEGLTDVNGELEDEIDYTSAQPIIGKVRKSSASPYYRSTPVVGSIVAAGFDGQVQMIRDE